MRYGFRAYSRDFLIAQRGVSHRFLSVREASRKRLPDGGHAYAIYPIAQRDASHRSSIKAYDGRFVQCVSPISLTINIMVIKRFFTQVGKGNKIPPCSSLKIYKHIYLEDENAP